MINISQLLQPISGTSRCGSDPQADSRFEVIRSLIESGTPDSAPDWRKLRTLIVELLSDGRSLDLLVYLAVTSAALEGWQGVRDGLVLISESLVEYWEDIHPLPDGEEPESERFWGRCNLLAQLGEPPRKPGDPLGYLEKVLRAPLSFEGRSAPGFWAVWEFEQGGNAGDESAAVKEHLQRMSPTDRDQLRKLVADATAAVERIEGLIATNAGTGYSASLTEHLLKTLQATGRSLDAATGGILGAEEAPGKGATSFGAGQPVFAHKNQAAANAAITSSEDVRRILNRVIDYYRKSEPSSPVPLLLQRALKLVDADFIAIVKNLNKDSEYQFRTTLDVNENS